MKMQIITEPENCIGCRGCEVVCSLVHAKECNPTQARIYVLKNPFKRRIKIQVKSTCDLCGGQPECVRWCPNSALKLVKMVSEAK